jgi:predicted metalloendopeptidase
VLKSDFKEKFNKLREKNDRKEWISGPAIVNAFYSPPANQICIKIFFYFSKNF